MVIFIQVFINLTILPALIFKTKQHSNFFSDKLFILACSSRLRRDLWWLLSFSKKKPLLVNMLLGHLEVAFVEFLLQFFLQK